jgi:hypothetical protein
MATAKRKTAPKKTSPKASRPTKATTAKRPVASKPVKARASVPKKPAQQSEVQYSTRVQLLVTVFALLCVVFAAMAFTNY